MDTLRKCVKCKQEKPASTEFFYKDKNRYLGLMYRCKECDRQRKDNRIYALRIANRSEEQIERVREKQRKYNQSEAGKVGSQLNAYQKFDKVKGYDNDLTKEDIIRARTGSCEYCGFPSTGFDRIDNSKGHLKDNVVPCCKECNVARMDNFTHDEMKVIGQTIRMVKLQRAA